MKHLIHAVIITCIGTILISLNNKPINPPVTETVPETHTEASQELLEPIVADIPQPAQEAIVEPVQTVNQVQANVTYNSVGCENYRHLVEQYDWDVRIALAVMKAESGCNPQAYNPEAHRGCNGSLGLFQIACVHHDSTFDPAGNVASAYRIYSSGGWRPWGAFTNGSYTRYL
jgi:hypothetical protein